MKLTAKANAEAGDWEIHDEHGFLFRIQSESKANELVRTFNVLLYMVKALRMLLEERRGAIELTASDLEWIKRVLAVAESRIRKVGKEMNAEQKLERALSLLAQTTTTLRDVYCGYRPQQCAPHPAECVKQNKEFFESIGQLDSDTRETWTIE